MEIWKYFQVLLHRRTLIVLTTLATILVVIAGLSRIAPTYTASTTLRVVPLGVNSPDYGTYVYFDRLANTYSEIIKSATVSDAVKTELGLSTMPSFHIDTVPQTELMKLSVDSADPILAAKVANSLTEKLIAQNEAFYKSGGGGVESILATRLAQNESDLNNLIKQRADLENQVPSDPEKIAELNRSIDTSQQNYSITLASYNQALIAQSTLASAVSITEPATPPVDPSAPRKTTDIAVGAIVGLLGGIALAYGLEAVNPRLYSDRQLERLVNSPIIGKIPVIRRQNRREVFSKDPRAAEAYRLLRTNIAYRANETSIRSLLVTSTTSREGKSMTAANLAIAIARTNQPVILVDCDLRMPSAHTFFNLPNAVGLSTLLENQAVPEDAVQRTHIDNLGVLTTGPMTPDTPDLLGTKPMATLFGDLLRRFNVIVVDGPPLLITSDAAILASYVDGTVLVLDVDKVNQKALTASRDQLNDVGANLLGVVINRARKDITFLRHNTYASRR